MELNNAGDFVEQQLSNLSVNDVFRDDFPIQDLQNKISQAEQISCCVLKRIERNINQRVNLVCSKQKCQFIIKLALSSTGDKYSLREIQDKHNHGVSADKFEEKMLTGRLLKYSDFIYTTYFLTDSEFSSKPKLILKDLKQTHGIDLLTGDFDQQQKQKLKKKFDNIIQQLRIKRQKQAGISNSSDQSQQISGISLAKRQSQQILRNKNEQGNNNNNSLFPHQQLNSSTSLQNTLQKDTNNIQQSLNFDPSTAASMSSQRLLQSTQTMLPSAQTILQKQMSNNSSMNFNLPSITNMGLQNNPFSQFLPQQQLQQYQTAFQSQLQEQMMQQQKYQQEQQNLILRQFMEINNQKQQQQQQLQVLFEDSPSVSGSLCKVEELSEMSPNIDTIESEPKKIKCQRSSSSASSMLPTQKPQQLMSNILPQQPSNVSAFPTDDTLELSSLDLTSENLSQFNTLFAQLLQQQQQQSSNYLQLLQQQQQLTQAQLLLSPVQQNLQSNLNSFQNPFGFSSQNILNYQQLQQSHIPLTTSEGSSSMNSSILQNLFSQLYHPVPNSNSSGLLTQSLADLDSIQKRQGQIQQANIACNQTNNLTMEQQQQQISMAAPQNQ